LLRAYFELPKVEINDMDDASQADSESKRIIRKILLVGARLNNVSPSIFQKMESRFPLGHYDSQSLRFSFERCLQDGFVFNQESLEVAVCNPEHGTNLFDVAGYGNSSKADLTVLCNVFYDPSNDPKYGGVHTYQDKRALDDANWKQAFSHINSSRIIAIGYGHLPCFQGISRILAGLGTHKLTSGPEQFPYAQKRAVCVFDR
jgi:hypothetical protein